jgi:hypothetical protein
VTWLQLLLLEDSTERATREEEKMNIREMPELIRIYQVKTKLMSCTGKICILYITRYHLESSEVVSMLIATNLELLFRLYI